MKTVHKVEVHDNADAGDSTNVDYSIKSIDLNDTNFDSNGLDVNGFDIIGFDANGFDINGFDAYGLDANGYDIYGFDIYGFDADGFDANGFDIGGFDTNGFDIKGFDTNGFDANGFDVKGVNAKGFDIKKDSPVLREVLSQRPDGHSPGRRRRGLRMDVPVELPGHQDEEYNTKNSEFFSPVNKPEKKASSTICVLDNNDDSTGTFRLKQSAKENTNSNAHGKEGRETFAKHGEHTLALINETIDISDVFKTPKTSQGISAAAPIDVAVQSSNLPPQAHRQSLETENGSSMVSEMVSSSSNILNSQQGAKTYDPTGHGTTSLSPGSSREVTIKSKVDKLTEDNVFKSTDEENFLTDFTCCGKTLANLHDLLQHYEEAHTQAPVATPRVPEPEFAEYLTLSPGSLKMGRGPSLGRGQHDAVNAYSTQQVDEEPKGQFLTSQLLSAIPPHQNPPSDEISAANQLGAQVASQIFDGPYFHADGSLRKPLDLSAQLTVQRLYIGKSSWWEGNPEIHLTIGYCAKRSAMLYYIKQSNRAYKIEYPFTDIENYAYFKHNSTRSLDAFVTIHLRRPPKIFQHQQASDSFYPCTIFDSNYTPFQELLHVLRGDRGVFDKQFEILEAIEPFRGRRKAYDTAEEPEPLTCKDDETFTDSGYASMLNRRYGLGDNSQNHEIVRQTLESKVPLHEEDVEDTKTVLSTATTINSHLAQDSIDWVCDNIYARFCHTIDETGSEILRACLPGLLKAFAVKFGTNTSDPSHLRIMHFVYKRYKKIVSQLNARFDSDRDPKVEGLKDETPNMSILEKMQLWGNISNSQRTSIENEGKGEINIDEEAERYHQETEDEDGDEIDGDDDGDDEDHPAMPTEAPSDSKTILESQAYQWLLSALSKQLSAHWGSSQPKVMIDEIRNTILTSLPTSTISRRRPPRTFTVTFKILWETMRIRAQQEWARRVSTFGSFSIGSLVVLTGTSDVEIQATTVKQYLQQTWPEGEIDILKPLQKLLEQHQGNSSLIEINTNDDTVHCHLDGPYLLISISGTAYSIAQCGEQLAWLTAALQPLDQKGLMLTPRIHEISGLNFSIEATSKSFVDSGALSSHQELSSQLFYGRLIPSCITRGFPIARRPEGFQGLEIPWYEILTLLQKPGLSPAGDCANNQRLLTGVYGTLELVYSEDGVCLWHESNPPSTGCVCWADSAETLRGNIINTITFEELSICRHVIGTCKRPQDFSTGVIRDATEASGPNAKGSEATLPAECSLEHYTAGSTQDDSVDSEILSISSFSQETQLSRLEISEATDVIHLIIKSVSGRLVEGFSYYMASMATRNDGETSSNNASTSSASGTSATPVAITPQTTATGQSRKRPYSQRDCNENEEDGFQKPPSKKLKEKQASVQRRFACPFWKYNSVQYHECFLFKLNDVSRVKQHLLRIHTPQHYCPRCKIIFKTKDSCYAHVMSPSGLNCAPDESPRLVSQEQWSRLSRKHRHPTEVERWFKMWDIVFPGIPPPKSPYLDGEMSKDCAQFQEHCRRHGTDILAEIIESSGALAMSLTESMRADMLRRAITTGLDALVSNWTRPTEGTQDTVLRAPPFDKGQENSSIVESSLIGTPACSFSASVMMANRATSSESHHPPHQQHDSEEYMPLDLDLNNGLKFDSVAQEPAISPTSLVQQNLSSVEPSSTFAIQSPTQGHEESFYTNDSQVIGPLNNVQDEGIEPKSFALSEQLDWVNGPWIDWTSHA